MCQLLNAIRNRKRSAYVFASEKHAFYCIARNLSDAKRFNKQYMLEQGVQNTEVIISKCTSTGLIQEWFLRELKIRGWEDWIEWIKSNEPIR